MKDTMSPPILLPSKYVVYFVWHFVLVCDAEKTFVTPKDGKERFLSRIIKRRSDEQKGVRLKAKQNKIQNSKFKKNGFS